MVITFSNKISIATFSREFREIMGEHSDVTFFSSHKKTRLAFKKA